MRLIRARMIDDYSTDDAQQICDIVESCLDIKLCKRAPSDPTPDGHINTSSNGSCEIYIYDSCLLSDETILTKLSLVDQQREDFEIISGVEQCL